MDKTLITKGDERKIQKAQEYLMTAMGNSDEPNKIAAVQLAKNTLDQILSDWLLRLT